MPQTATIPMELADELLGEIAAIGERLEKLADRVTELAPRDLTPEQESLIESEWAALERAGLVR